MTKEEFVKQINDLIEFDNKFKQLNSIFNTDNNSINFHYNITENYVKNISILTGIDEELIGMFLWDCNQGELTFYENDNKILIIGAEELWDYHKQTK